MTGAAARTVETVVSGRRCVLVEAVESLLRGTRFVVAEGRDAGDRAALHIVIEAALGRAEASREIERLVAGHLSGCVLVIASDEDPRWAERAGADACLPHSLSAAAFIENLGIVADEDLGAEPGRRPARRPALRKGPDAGNVVFGRFGPRGA